MTAAGLPVPDGFVALTSCYNRFMAERGLGTRISTRLVSMSAGDVDGLREAAAAITGWVLAEPIPECVSTQILDMFDSLASPW
jgi:pyruvate,water dikinase